MFQRPSETTLEVVVRGGLSEEGASKLTPDWWESVRIGRMSTPSRGNAIGVRKKEKEEASMDGAQQRRRWWQRGRQEPDHVGFYGAPRMFPVKMTVGAIEHFYFILFYLFIFLRFVKKKFYWSIVDLQCCISFRCTAKCISYTYTYIHSFFFFRFFSHIGHFRVLSRVPCAIL